MIDNYLLVYLVQFAQLGTIEKTAQSLGVTKATVSRGLSKLETEFHTKLFDRQPQKISLTPTGKFAASQAAQIIRLQKQLKAAVENYAQKHHIIRVGGTVLGPLWLLAKITATSKANIEINQTPLPSANMADHLLHHRFTMIISSQKIATSRISSILLGEEQLFIKVTQFNRLYERSSVKLQDLNGHEFIVDDRLGDWRAIIETAVPQAKFLYQRNPHAMQELIQHSNFPIFKTSITAALDHDHDAKRRLIPIEDPQAHLQLYANFLQDNYRLLQPLIDRLQQQLTKLNKR